jgi:hypothetical protein
VASVVGRLPVGRESGSVQLDAVTADGNAFLAQKFKLWRSDRRAPVAAHATMPRHIGRMAARADGIARTRAMLRSLRLVAFMVR